MDSREQLWHATNDHVRDLMELAEEWLGEPTAQRRWRLAMCAFARRITQVAKFTPAERILDVVEGHIDRGVPLPADRTAVREYMATYSLGPTPQAMTLGEAARYSVQATIGGAETGANHLFEAMHYQTTGPCTDDPDVEWAAQAAIFKDIFGNPFRPVAFDPRWRSESAVALARTVYDTRNFTLLPILADAIEEAGCDHPGVLTHCRDPKQIHVRGCWVLDGVLGKG